MVITRRRFHDHKTKRRIYEHLANKGDDISEDDIRNVKTDGFDKEPPLHVSSELEIKSTAGQHENTKYPRERVRHAGEVPPWIY